MKMDRDIIINVLRNLNCNNLKCFNESYSFSDELNTNEDNEASIIEKFLHTYLNRVYLLCTLYEVEGKIFLKWFDEKGKFKLTSFLSDISYDKINLNRLIKIFSRYDILLEQSLYEKNSDSLLNLLVDIPLTVYDRLEEWGCLNLERKITQSDISSAFKSQYKSTKLDINNPNKYMTNFIPAAMQVSLL